jgi:hypothetical protein
MFINTGLQYVMCEVRMDEFTFHCEESPVADSPHNLGPLLIADVLDDK